MQPMKGDESSDRPDRTRPPTGLEFNVRVWFAAQARVPAGVVHVAKAEETADGGWEFGIERSAQPVGAVLVSPVRDVPGPRPSRLVVATWGVDQSATDTIDADRGLVWD
jgi:hypothetical protein